MPLRNDAKAAGPAKWTFGLWLAAWSLALLILGSLAWTSHGNHYDEGCWAYSSWRVFAGDVPGKELWLLYGPGTFYLHAGGFFFGDVSLATFRLTDLGVKLALLAAMVMLARRGGGGRWGLWTLAVGATAMGGLGIFGYSMLTSELFVLLAFLAWVRAAGKGAPRAGWAFFSGLLLAWVAFFRPDVGAYGLIAVTAAGLGQAGAHRDRGVLGCWGWMLAGALAGGGLIYGALAAQAGIGPLWDQLVRFPITGRQEALELPLPGLVRPFKAIKWWIQSGQRHNLEPLKIWVTYYPAMLLYAAGVVHSLRRLRSASGNAASALVPLMLGVFGLLLLLHSSRRLDMHHALPSVLCLAVLAAAILGQGGMRAPVLAFVGLFTIVQVGLGLHDWSQIVRDPAPVYQGVLPSLGAVPIGPDLGAAVESLRRQTDPAQPVLVANANQDTPLANHVLVLFLAQRRSATRLFEFHPGLWPEQGDEMAEALDEGKAPVVIWSGWVKDRGKSELDKRLWSYGRRAEVYGDFVLRYP